MSEYRSVKQDLAKTENENDRLFDTAAYLLGPYVNADVHQYCVVESQLPARGIVNAAIAQIRQESNGE